jgi:antitoxin component of MazEF toxin-antitoxin module
MQVVKIRKVGNSRVISLPREFESPGFEEGASVVIEALESGGLLVLPQKAVSDPMRALGERLVARHRQALDLLEAYDRGEAAMVDGEVRLTEGGPG